MNILQWYIIRQILSSQIIAVVVFTFILLLGNILKEIINLIISNDLDLWLVLRALMYLVPYALVFAVPISLLTATFMVFSKLSAENELTAIRNSGLSIKALIFPVILLSLVFCMVCAILNLNVGPLCRRAYKQLITDTISTSQKLVIPEGRFVDFGDSVLYVSKVKDTNLENLILYRFKDGQKIQDIRAPRGRVVLNPDSNELSIVMENAWILIRESLSQTNSLNLPEDTPKPQPAKWRPLFVNEFSQSIADISKLNFSIKKPKLSELTYNELLAEKKIRQSQGIDITPVLFQINRQISFSLACFSFVLIAIPLGIKTHKKEININVAVALILLFIYYSFIVTANSLDLQPQYYPQLIVWLPNLLFQAIGSILLMYVDYYS